jgi:hypothetical protein
VRLPRLPKGAQRFVERCHHGVRISGAALAIRRSSASALRAARVRQSARDPAPGVVALRRHRAERDGGGVEQPGDRRSQLWTSRIPPRSLSSATPPARQPTNA